ncbi:hypothetical protein [Actinomadura parmotrematis]|uniref:Uncharacterized protein n=1 Tax=Actinomadura parmotrematis TaxID=2864039 RepID=A0ABS7G464_9ACTN|nr:hypothetical protein [Actinomadura parmotrematis]MBW8487483.1 hypothetical protein [Actinomadura parmotrematis]
MTQSSVQQPTSRAHAHLAALLRRLDLYDLDAQIKPDGLRVANPHAEGCCPANPEPTDTVTCRPNPADSGRLWFFHSWAEPIAPASRTEDAAVLIARTLKAR